MNPLFLKADGVKVLTLKLGNEVKQITDTKIIELCYKADSNKARLTIEFEVPEE